MPHQNQYLVDVIGFNPTERAMLTSIFALAARRDPGFVQYDPVSALSPDLYLVDMDDGAAMGEFRALNRRDLLPVVLVASPGHGGSEEVVERPLQWARLLQALEDAVGDAEDTAPALLDTAPHDIGESTWARRSGAPLLRTPPPLAGSAPSDIKRALGDTVLVVDDNATVRAFMQAKLAPFRFEVDFAENGEEAVGLTGTREYACVFLDVVMPGIDGYQVCKLIKGNKNAIKKTAVVMLTSRTSPFDKLRGSLAGCDEYLTKPLDEDRLLEVIAKFLPSSRKRSGSSKHR
ncbi:MAG TPA: response regulator [Ramlibacter sp.]|nr:response regulator [Ramlibacter sp.]